MAKQSALSWALLRLEANNLRRTHIFAYLHRARHGRVVGSSRTCCVVSDGAISKQDEGKGEGEEQEEVGNLCLHAFFMAGCQDGAARAMVKRSRATIRS